MEAIFAPLVPMFIGAGILRVVGEVIAATVSNRFFRGIMLLGAFAIWGTWHFNYVMIALVK